MENGGSTITIKGILSLLMESISELEDEEGRCVKRVISLGMGDPTLYSCFRTTQVSLQAVSDSLLSNKFHGYAPTVGLPQTRRSFLSFTSFSVFFFPFTVLTPPSPPSISYNAAVYFIFFFFGNKSLVIIVERPGQLKIIYYKKTYIFDVIKMKPFKFCYYIPEVYART